MQGRGTDRTFAEKQGGGGRSRTFIHSVTIQAEPKDATSPNPDVDRNLKLKKIELEANQPIANDQSSVSFRVTDGANGTTIELNGMTYTVNIPAGKRKVKLFGRKKVGKGNAIPLTLQKVIFKDIEVVARSNTRYNLDIDSMAEVKFPNRFNKIFSLGDSFDRGIKEKDGRILEKPLTEVFPVGIYIKRVPKLVFSDADYRVPVFARVEGLPSDKTVEIQKLEVPLFRKKEEVDGSSSGKVKWGIGDGTTTDKQERNVKFKNQKKAPAGIKQRENGKLYFTAFVKNKEVLGSTVVENQENGKKIHLFNKAKNVSIPYFKIQDMRLSIKGAKERPNLPPVEKIFRDLSSDMSLMNNLKRRCSSHSAIRMKSFPH